MKKMAEAKKRIRQEEEEDGDGEMDNESGRIVKQRLLETVKNLELRDPMAWAKCFIDDGGLDKPSPELAQLLVSYLSSPTNHPSLWKFLHHALSLRLVSPLHVLSLLSSTLIPRRRSLPAAFRIFLELLTRHAFSSLDFASDAPPHPSSTLKIIKSVDAALHISETYKVEVLDFGQLFVFSFFTILVALIDATFCDWGLQMNSPNLTTPAFLSTDTQDVDIGTRGNYNFGRNDRTEVLRQTNASMAIEVLAKLSESRKAIILLRLVQFNMPEQFNGLLQRLQFYEEKKLATPYIKSTNQVFERLSANIKKVRHFRFQLNKSQLTQMLIDVEPLKPTPSCNYGIFQSACWVPFDIFMENIMNGKQLLLRSAISVLTELIKTLKVFNEASWHETFLALWISALRVVQRERDPLEGPIPHLDSRLCILLTIVPLAVANILKDDIRLSSSSSSSLREAATSEYMDNGEKYQVDGMDRTSSKFGIISSLQVLGHFSELLCPPSSVIGAANVAAAKAARFVSNSKNPRGSLGGGSLGDSSIDAGGNMWHLIVEACIARNLLDPSAYFWPGYSVISLSKLPPVQKSPWSTFMEGASLSDSLAKMLLVTPAPSLAEIEKLYHTALHGSIEEKSTAAKILCGASLIRGWNIQEHAVHHVIKLLSPPIPSGHTGQRSHLVDYMPMLSAILVGVSSVDANHILSLHGMIPELAASLMPLCEVFGSLLPTSNNKSSSNDEPSVYAVFSSAFLLLLRLWKFYRPPLEQRLTVGGAFGGGLSLEYLLLVRNSSIASHDPAALDEMDNNSAGLVGASDESIYVHFYPKLQAWYLQNKSCIASPLSGLSTGNPVHEVANKILNMIYWRMNKNGSSSGTSTPSGNGLCVSPPTSAEESYQRPMLPAWEVLEAIPFVLEAILTACAHGRLSSRDLTTGLRDFIEFLPASIGVIISYFSAEITRGVWKPVPMNGTDWPSPAAVISSIESEMKQILASAGVNSPSCSPGISHLMLPLPMAALVSLTITFKLSKEYEYIHAIVGPALEHCASACPWPTIPIISSLWAQKVRRWHHFIVGSSSLSAFRQNKDAVAQLLRSSFSSFLGYSKVSTSLLTNQSSVNGLLGNVVAVQGASPSIAPGFLFLRSCQTIQDIQYINDVIVGLVTEFARELATRRATTGSFCLKSGQTSLSSAIAKAREVAMLGATLICVSGGMNLVQELYRDTIPTWLLGSRAEKVGKVNGVSCIVEGYAMAYMLILSGSLVWGVGVRSPPWALSRRCYVVGAHMDFLARVLEGNISLGCHPSTWKAYVCCLVRLVVSFAPAWIREVKLETLKQLASGLRRWQECELALSLLEKGGVAAFGSVAELVDVIS